MEAKDRIIVALDGLNKEQACEAIEELHPYVGAFKVGFDLITRQHARFVYDFAAQIGVKVAWDGKFHDIPQTVAYASSAVADMVFIKWLNVHCLGGFKMMQAAKQAVVDKCGSIKRPLVLGVTILTSHDYDSLVRLRLLPPLDQAVLEQSDGGESVMQSAIQGLVLNLAELAQESGLDGVIASPKEIKAIRAKCGPNFRIVCPGVRPKGAAINDQMRVMTPTDAILAGVDEVVLGRPILNPATGSRIEAAQNIGEEVYLADIKSAIHPKYR